MYYINKLVFAILNPLGVAFVLMFIALMIKLAGYRFAKAKHTCFRLAWLLIVFCVMWLWIWNCNFVYKALGGWLEAPYVDNTNPQCWAPLAEGAPMSDAIVLLGGGMGCQTNGYPYADMNGPADRVWHAARLYHAGKAPLIFCSGISSRWSTLPLLKDLGVPMECVVVEDQSRNTEENAKFTERILLGRDVSRTRISKPRILLVTSAWHMRRSEFMFKKYAPGLDVVPCPTDFVATMCIRDSRGVTVLDFLPHPDFMPANAAMLKEIMGLIGYRIFR